LAERGAQVVVNDLGGSMGGTGVDAQPANDVVEEIVDAGGAAVADGNDVSTTDGAEALVATALDAFGRVDALVNNAGIMRWSGLPDLELDDVEAHLAVHVAGAFNTVRAAWPRFVEQGYGRIVMTTSAGLFGLPDNTAYATAKGGIVGLTRSLALAGAPHGIKVNALAPAAWTRMAGDPARAGDMPTTMAPELVAPMAALLAHEGCPVTGEVYAAGAGRFSRIFLAATPGYLTDATPTIEDVADHWDEINDETGYTVPTDLNDWSARFMAHLFDRPVD
jgi:NAD(P)-dependent dehydrogenase (short-subunit alcohol dehydrogenase family)